MWEDSRLIFPPPTFYFEKYSIYRKAAGCVQCVLRSSSPKSPMWQCDTESDSISDGWLPTTSRSHLHSQLLVCSKPGQADATAHVVLPLVPVGTQSAWALTPTWESPRTTCNHSETCTCWLSSHFQTCLGVCTSPLAKPRYESNKLSHTLLVHVWDHQSRHSNQILGWGGSISLQVTGTNVWLFSPLPSPPPLLLSLTMIIIFGWTTWELFVDIMMI